VNDQDILSCAEQAAEWLLDRRKRLEKHQHDSAAQHTVLAAPKT
jgi:hypothetical protein